VRALSLSHNWIGDAGVAVLCDAIRARPTVTALDIPDNKVRRRGLLLLLLLQQRGWSCGGRGAAAVVARHPVVHGRLLPAAPTTSRPMQQSWRFRVLGIC
jgi:hypothetical protein